MLTTPQQREVDRWLIKNQPQVQHLLETNNLKALLYEVYEVGRNSIAEDNDTIKNQIEEGVQSRIQDDNLTSYSSVLINNL